MRPALKAAGRPPRRFAHWLAGQPHLLALLQDQRRTLADQQQQLSDQLSAVAAQQTALADLHHMVRAVEANICRRLDGLAEAAVTEPSLTHAEFTEGLTAEVDRLDGYLVHHSDEIRRVVVGASGETQQMLARKRQFVPLGAELDVLLTDGDVDLVVPTREEGLVAFLARHGTSGIEPGVRAVLTARLRPGDVAVDVGANVGVHALDMATAVGAAGRLLCFEPMPHIGAALLRTLRINGFGERSEIHSAAVADRDGTAEFYPAAHSPLSSLFPLPDGVTDGAVEVDVTTLDSVLAPGSRVDVVKIDVEGAEPLVWRGMQRVLRENHRLAIVLEWSASHFARSGEDPSQFMREIVSHGFEVSRVEDDVPGHLVPLDVDDAAHLEGRNVALLRG